jgi:hypothetical protein
MNYNLSIKTIIPFIFILLFAIIVMLLSKYNPLIESINYFMSASLYFTVISSVAVFLWAGTKSVSLSTIILKQSDVKYNYHREMLMAELKPTNKIKIYSFFKESCFVSLDKGDLLINYKSHNNLNINSTNDIAFIKDDVNEMLSIRYKQSHV